MPGINNIVIIVLFLTGLGSALGVGFYFVNKALGVYER